MTTCSLGTVPNWLFRHIIRFEILVSRVNKNKNRRRRLDASRRGILEILFRCEMSGCGVCHAECELWTRNVSHVERWSRLMCDWTVHRPVPWTKLVYTPMRPLMFFVKCKIVWVNFFGLLFDLNIIHVLFRGLLLLTPLYASKGVHLCIDGVAKFILTQKRKSFGL